MNSPGAAGDPWPFGPYGPYGYWPHPIFPTYHPIATDNTAGCRPLVPVDEQKVREIIREELQKALAALHRESHVPATGSELDRLATDFNKEPK